jgi:hypothetical protein
VRPVESYQNYLLLLARLQFVHERKGHAKPRNDFGYNFPDGEIAMPIHDWSRVPSGLFHHFRQDWSIEIARTLNRGRLPKGLPATCALWSRLSRPTKRPGTPVPKSSASPSKREWCQNPKPSE